MPSPSLHCISSMATRLLLGDLAAQWQQHSGVETRVESVGGVDAAKRVAAGEAFDVVVLASDALAKLQATGHVVAGSCVDLVRSGVAVAVREGAAKPDIGSEAALQRAVQAARSIGYSTGPSGTQLLALFERWGLADALREKLVQAPPGVPVGQLVAEGRVELGFQQSSELMSLPGITVLGAMPAPVQITTVFSAGLATASERPDAVRPLLAWLAAPAQAAIKARQGMEAA